MDDQHLGEIKRSAFRFIAGAPDDPRRGYGLCLNCPGKTVHYQEATRIWIYDDGSSHTGHLIELLPETERKPLELSEMLAGQAPISLEVKALAAAPDLLHKIKIDLDRFIVGEDENKLHLFLICLSSATSKPSGAIITAYHDIQSKGVEFLRSLYGNSGLRIRARSALTTKDQLRAMARGFGLSPEEAARLLTSSEPHRAYATQEEREEHETRILCDIITEHLKKKILGGQPPPNTRNSVR